MRREEITALGELAAEGAAGVVGQVRDVHAGVARRVFGSLRVLGGAAEPVRLIHDGLSAGAYAAAGTLTGALVRGGAGAISLTRSHDDPSVLESVPGRVAVGAINGMWGDRLYRRGSALETPMAVRQGGRDVAVDRESLARAFPAATPRIVVFTHGLCETEEAWRFGAGRGVPYGDRLRAELGYTPVYVRYNSGLHISVNGRRLAGLLDDLTENWPVEVAELALIGHSMGGLVARGACHYAAEGSWRDRVRHVFTLGSPHKGAPLELGANALCHAASLVPELKPFAAPIRVRAVGVKDLGYGYVVDEDWRGHDPDAFWTNTGTELPFLESANHYFVSATVTRDPNAPLGRLVGDLLVLRKSAWSQQGPGRRLQFPVDRYRHLGGANHLDLLNHPAVYAQLRNWLGGRPELPESAAA
jgi:alpha-beta hydrolase superfamily lysophospholipase